MKKSNISNKLTAGLVVAALLAAPLASSAAPRHTPPPFRGHSAPAHFESRGPWHEPHGRHALPRHHEPPRHHHHDDYRCDSDFSTGVAAAVGTLAAIGLVAAFCAD